MASRTPSRIPSAPSPRPLSRGRSYVPTTGGKLLGIGQPRNSPGSSPLSQPPMVPSPPPPDKDKPLPSPPFAVIVNPDSPIKVSRTLLDATDASTPTEEQFPVIKPSNLELEAASKGVESPYLPSSPPELFGASSPVHGGSSVLPSSPASPNGHQYVDDSPLAARHAHRHMRRHGITSVNELQRENTDKYPIELPSGQRTKTLKSASTRWPRLDTRPRSSGVTPPPPLPKDSPKDSPKVTPRKSASFANLRSAGQRPGAVFSSLPRRPSLHQLPTRTSKFSEELYSSPPQPPTFTSLRPGSRMKRLSAHSQSPSFRSGLGGLLTIDKDADDVLIKKSPQRLNARTRTRLPVPSPKSPQVQNYSRPIAESQNPAVKFKRSIRNMFTKHKEKAPELPAAAVVHKEHNTKRFSFRSPKKPARPLIPEPMQRDRFPRASLLHNNNSASSIGRAVAPPSPTPSNPSLGVLLTHIEALPAGSVERQKALEIAQALVTSIHSAAEAKIAAAKAEEFARNAELHARTAQISLERLMGLARDESGEGGLRAIRQMVRDAGLMVPGRK